MNKKVKTKQTIPYVILLIVIVTVLAMFSFGGIKVNTLTKDEFYNALAEDKVKEIVTSEHSGDGVYYVTGKLKDYKDNETFKVNLDLSESTVEFLTNYQQLNEFKWTVEENPENSSWLAIIVNIVPLLIIVGGTIFLFTKLNGSNKSSMDF